MGGPMGGFDPAMPGGGFNDPAMMFQPEGIDDLDPQIPGSDNPLQIGGVRRPNRPPQGGMFGPGGNLMGPGGFGGGPNGGFGGPGGPGGNMFM